jgi:hypothetical protein
MYKSLDKYTNKLTYVLSIFKNEVLVKFNKEKLDNIEKKLGIRYDDDIIPNEIKELIFKDNK